MLVPEKAEAEYESIQRVLAARQQLSATEVEEAEAEAVLDGRLLRRSSLIAIAAAAVMELDEENDEVTNDEIRDQI